MSSSLTPQKRSQEEEQPEQDYTLLKSPPKRVKGFTALHHEVHIDRDQFDYWEGTTENDGSEGDARQRVRNQYEDDADDEDEDKGGEDGEGDDEDGELEMSSDEEKEVVRTDDAAGETMRTHKRARGKVESDEECDEEEVEQDDDDEEEVKDI